MALAQLLHTHNLTLSPILLIHSTFPSGTDPAAVQIPSEGNKQRHHPPEETNDGL